MNMDDYRKVTDRIYPSDKCREEVMNMRSDNNRKKIKHRHTGKAVAAIAVAVVAACGGTVAAAAKLGAFERLSLKNTRTVTNTAGDEFPIDKFDKNDYASIAPAAVDVDDTEPQTNEDITISIESVYCDGQELIFALNGSLNNGNSVGAGYISCRATLYVNGKYQEPINPYGCSFVIDEDEENSFTGSVTYILTGKNKITETSDIELNLAGFNAREKYWTDPLLESEAPVSLRTQVKPNLSLVRDFGENGITAEKDGFYFTVYSISPAMMLCHGGYPESYDIAMQEEIENGTEDGYCHAVHPLVFVFDEDGNYIEGLPMNPIDMPDGELASACVSTDSKTLTIKVGDKNCQSNENGSIEFDDQYGHQSFGYITEFTLDLDE